MKLIFQPVKPFNVTQKFGENKACKPVDGSQKTIYCDGLNPPDGWMSLYGSKGHRAIDLRTSHGQEVYAAQDGVCYFIDTNPQSGLDVRLEHEMYGVKYRTIYEHLMGHNVKVKDAVKCGQLIGWADNTGWSSGDHLHFVLQFQKDGVWTNVDPMLYMEDMCALDALLIQDKLTYLKQMVAKLADLLAVKLRK